VESLLRPALKLASAELVVLSACNSASEEFWRTPDEAIGFPAALLVAGAQTVIAAQWEVSDAATFLLLQRFCQEFFDTHFDAAQALSNSQRWLRSASSIELAATVNAVRERLGDNEHRNKRLLSELSEQLLTGGNDTPLADRRFWAGFVCVGA
jgi:CHAT domain-containing protein